VHRPDRAEDLLACLDQGFLSRAETFQQGPVDVEQYDLDGVSFPVRRMPPRSADDELLKPPRRKLINTFFPFT